jgi:hypothetical protein
MLAMLQIATTHCATPNRGDQARRVRELIEVQAWTEAALALVGFERGRAVRRLIHEEGDWHCTLGSQWPIPEWLDDTCEFSHPALPLAILGALAEALRRANAPAVTMTAAPRPRSESPDVVAAVSCDNFA